MRSFEDASHAFEQPLPIPEKNAETLTEEQTKLLLDMMGYARAVSKHVMWNHADEDIYQSGIVGLIEAIKNFDDTKGQDIKAYAFSYIKGEVIEEVRGRNFLKRKSHAKVRAWNNAEASLTQELQRLPSPDEIAEYIGLDKEELREVQRLVRIEKPLSLSAPGPISRSGRDIYLESQIIDPEENEAGEYYTELEDIYDPTEDEIIEILDRPRTLELVRESIKSLVPTQKEVIVKHFLGGVAISSIAQEQGVSFQAINQRKNIALRHLSDELLLAA